MNRLFNHLAKFSNFLFPSRKLNVDHEENLNHVDKNWSGHAPGETNVGCELAGPNPGPLVAYPSSPTSLSASDSLLATRSPGLHDIHNEASFKTPCFTELKSELPPSTSHREISEPIDNDTQRKNPSKRVKWNLEMPKSKFEDHRYAELIGLAPPCGKYQENEGTEIMNTEIPMPTFHLKQKREELTRSTRLDSRLDPRIIDNPTRVEPTPKNKTELSSMIDFVTTEIQDFNIDDSLDAELQQIIQQICTPVRETVRIETEPTVDVINAPQLVDDDALAGLPSPSHSQQFSHQNESSGESFSNEEELQNITEVPTNDREIESQVENVAGQKRPLPEEASDIHEGRKKRKLQVLEDPQNVSSTSSFVVPDQAVPTIQDPGSGLPSPRRTRRSFTQLNSKLPPPSTSRRVLVKSEPINNTQRTILFKRVKCGVCNLDMPESKFEGHRYAEHMGLARPYGMSQEFSESEKKRELKQTLLLMKQINCSSCLRIFTTLNGFQYHQSSCLAEVDDSAKLVDCHLCGKQVGAFRAHMKIHAKEENEQLAKELEEMKIISCPHCDSKYSTVRGFLYHKERCAVAPQPPITPKITRPLLRKKSTKRNEKCKVCGKKAMFMKSHMKLHERTKKGAFKKQKI